MSVKPSVESKRRVYFTRSPSNSHFAIEPHMPSCYIDRRTPGKYTPRIPTAKHIEGQQYAFGPAFDTEEEADAWGAKHKQLLADGIVPEYLISKKNRTAPSAPLLIEVMRNYEKSQTIAPSDAPLLLQLLKELPPTRIDAITGQWALDLVAKYKEKELAPSTIRKRIESLARVMDWHFRAVAPEGKEPQYNPLRDMPRGYSVYADAEVKDVKRNFRIAGDILEAIDQALAGEKNETSERALPVDPAFTMLYRLIMNTGMRLREAYWLMAGQFDRKNGLLHVNGTKGHRGVIKPRTVPLTDEMFDLMLEFVPEGTDPNKRIFPFLVDMTDVELTRCTARLSARFKTLFTYAGAPELNEHDMRHEAACRWVEMKTEEGQWAFTETHICKMMGWEDTKMMLRYASLRGEDLANIIRRKPKPELRLVA